MFLLFGSPFTIGHSPCVGEPIFDDGDQGALDEFMDQLGRGVEGAGGFTFQAVSEGE